MTACKAETIDVSFMVYNYSTTGLGEVKVNGEGSTIVDGAERLGSVGGGGTACCISLNAKSETADVSFLQIKEMVINSTIFKFP